MILMPALNNALQSGGGVETAIFQVEDAIYGIVKDNAVLSGKVLEPIIIKGVVSCH